MKASWSWLSDYVAIETDAEKLAAALTMVGLEVDSMSDRYDFLKSVQVGKILAVRPHPNADKLTLCDVDIGDRNIIVVCGAPNVKKDLLVPAALPNTTLPDGTTLTKSVIRGEASEGMLCSEAELGLGLDRSGIMELNPKLTVGQNLKVALNLSDPVIEIDLTPNRPDCLSVIGIAREIAGIQKMTVQYPDSGLIDTANDIIKHTSVTIQAPDLCPRYAARLLDHINIAPSPFWLQDRLNSVGLRPINNIVDITNFVMMETGQPLHAFDFDQLADHKIVVRSASDGERFTTLDDKERRLSQDMLMICDGRQPVGIGGVMGGLNSEIQPTTRRVLLESAYFNPVSIRRTSKTLGLNTEASHRFERGVDPQGTIRALNRAAKLMASIEAGSLVSGLIDEHPKPAAPVCIDLNVKATNRLLGTKLKGDNIQDLLESIEFSTSRSKPDIIAVIPPSFRVDVFRPEDLMEEVARLSGYNHIPTTFPVMPAEARKPLRILAVRDRIRRLMTGWGFTEVVNYSFIGKNAGDQLALKSEDPRRNTVDILNPLTEDQAVMRTSLVPGLLQNLHRNVSKQEKSLKLFEIGKVFLATHVDSLPVELEMLIGLWSGARNAPSWLHKETNCDFFDIKGVVEALLNRLAVDEVEFVRPADGMATYSKPGYTADILVAGQQFGMVGEIHPMVLNQFDLQQTVYYFEVDLDKIVDEIPEGKTARPIPKYPAAPRDMTVIVDKTIEAAKIIGHVEKLDENLIETLFLFDVFEGKPIPRGKKSLSLRIVYRSNQRTLEDDEVNLLHKNITEGLINAFGATLPT